MRINPDVVFRQLGDSAVLVDLSTNRIFELNETGAAIWAHLGREVALDSVVAELVQAFDVDRATAAREVDSLMAQLSRLGLLAP